MALTLYCPMPPYALNGTTGLATFSTLMKYVPATTVVVMDVPTAFVGLLTERGLPLESKRVSLSWTLVPIESTALMKGRHVMATTPPDVG